MSKADEQNNQPSEEQVKQANAAEEAKWQGDFKEEDLLIPYKREDEEKNDDKADAGAAKSSDKDDAKATEADDDSDDEEDLEAYSEPAPVVTVNDPGEFKPKDYSFEVTLKDGKTKKINSIEEADALAEDPDNFETPKQLLNFMRKAQKMENQLEKDKEAYDKDKEAFDKQNEEAQRRQETTEAYVREFEYLESEGLLPKIDEADRNADWSDPKVAAKPGVKEQIQLLNYMVKQNEKRNKAGVRPITSIVDAYNAWSNDQKRKEEAQANKKAGEARKEAGARVAGVSPTQTGAYVPKGIAVGNPNILKRGAAQWDD